MGVEIAPDSFAGVFALFGAGLTVLRPTDKWIGWLLIVSAVVILCFDVRFTGGAPHVGSFSDGLNAMAKMNPWPFLAISLITFLVFAVVMYQRSVGGNPGPDAGPFSGKPFVDQQAESAPTGSPLPRPNGEGRESSAQHTHHRASPSYRTQTTYGPCSGNSVSGTGNTQTNSCGTAP